MFFFCDVSTGSIAAPATNLVQRARMLTFRSFFSLCHLPTGSMAAPANDRRAKMNDQKRLDIETFGNLGGVRHTSFGEQQNASNFERLGSSQEA